MEPGEQEITLSKRHIYQPSMFGVSMHDLIDIQKDKFPELEIPWIQVRRIQSSPLKWNTRILKKVFHLRGVGIFHYNILYNTIT